MMGDMPVAMRKRGVVISFLPRKGYGFIKGDGEEQLFVHFSDIRGKGYRILEVGEEVEYSRVDSERGGQARDVVRLNPPKSEPVVQAEERKRTW
jgi:CspA family cold shock protein